MLRWPAQKSTSPHFFERGDRSTAALSQEGRVDPAAFAVQAFLNRKREVGVQVAPAHYVSKVTLAALVSMIGVAPALAGQPQRNGGGTQPTVVSGTPAAASVGDIYVTDGAVTLGGADAARGAGASVIHAIDPTIIFNAAGTYNNPISLESSNTTTDPTILRNTSGGAVTLAGAITQAPAGSVNAMGGVVAANQPVTFDNGGVVGGVTILTNSANTWSGATTVNSGATLQGQSTTISGSSINDNGALVYNQAAAGSVGQVISGTGTLVVQGQGALTLTNANTYTGATSIGLDGAPGALTLVGAGSIAASSSVNLIHGTLDISGARAGTSLVSLSGDVSSSVVLGKNTLTLTNAAGNFMGDITGTGGLTIARGTETLSYGLYSGQTAILAGATLALAGPYSFDPYTTVADAGALDISGETDGSVSIAGLTGAGKVKLGDNELYLTGASGVFSGAMSGVGGGFEVYGGKETLSGVITYTGATTITPDASLTLKGGTSLATSSSVEADGILDVSQVSGGVQLTSLSGVGQVLLGANTLTLNNASGNFIGLISGSGGLTIASGAEGIGSSQAYTGVTTINSGATLALTSNVYISPFASATTGSISSSSNVVVQGTLDLSQPTIFNYEAGELPVSLSIQSLSGNGTVILGQNILYLNNANGSFSGSITGAAYNRFASFGSAFGVSGSETLTGVNTYLGPTFISTGASLALAGAGSIATTSSVQDSGTFNIAGLTTGGASVGSLAGAGGVTLGANNLSLSNAADTFSGSINGAGGLTLLAGAETLSGANTYTGVTTVNGGTLILAGTGSDLSVNSPVVVNPGGVLAVASNQTLAELSGPGAVTLGNALLAVGADGTSTTFSGTITGAGGLTKIGVGELFLTGTSTYTGSTLVEDGDLSVNGSIAASAVTVGRAGVLKGDGTVGALAVNGVVAPGNSIGTLSVAGALTFGAGSVYQAEVNAAGQSDLIAAGGTATLGGQVQVIASSGTYARATFYQILSAAAVSGTFRSVTSNFAFLTPTLIYTSNAVDLALVNNDVPFQSVASTDNQRAAASAAYALGSSSALYNTISIQTDAGAREAFNAISGQIYADAPAELAQESRYEREAVLDRLHDVSDNLSAGTVQAGSYGGVADVTVWARGLGAWTRTSAQGGGNVSSTQADITGAILGIDAKLPLVAGRSWRAGVATAYSDTPLQDLAAVSQDEIHSTHLTGYTGGPLIAGLQARLGFDYDWSRLTTHRAVDFPGFAEVEQSSQGARISDVFGEIGRTLVFGRLRFEPFANAAFVHAEIGSADENGGSAALRIGKDALDATLTEAGLRASLSWRVSADAVVRPYMTIAERHAFGNDGSSALLGFEAGGAPFLIRGVALDRDAGHAEVGAVTLVGPKVSFSLGYSGDVSGHWQDQTLNFTGSYRF